MIQGAPFHFQVSIYIRGVLKNPASLTGKLKIQGVTSAANVTLNPNTEDDPEGVYDGVVTIPTATKGQTGQVVLRAVDGNFISTIQLPSETIEDDRPIPRFGEQQVWGQQAVDLVAKTARFSVSEYTP